MIIRRSFWQYIVPWRGGVKRQWGNRKDGFSGLYERYVFGTLENEANYVLFSPL